MPKAKTPKSTTAGQLKVGDTVNMTPASSVEIAEILMAGGQYLYVSGTDTKTGHERSRKMRTTDPVEVVS